MVVVVAVSKMFLGVDFCLHYTQRSCSGQICLQQCDVCMIVVEFLPPTRLGQICLDSPIHLDFTLANQQLRKSFLRIRRISFFFWGGGDFIKVLEKKTIN